MGVRELFIQAPHLCGAAWPEKKAKIAELVWDHEMAGKGFGRVDGETARDRIAFLLDWKCLNEDVREYCLQLLELDALAHYGNEHGDKQAKIEAEKLEEKLAPQEVLYPQIAAYLTVEQAAGGWWGE